MDNFADGSEKVEKPGKEIFDLMSKMFNSH